MYNTIARGQGRNEGAGLALFKGVSVMSLFKQRYADRILSRRNRAEPSKDPSKQMRAYNTAVREEFEILQREDNAAYQALKDSVQQMKAASSLPFHQQEEHVQKA